jgi:Pentapeptide repeats (8 copies)
MLAQKAGGKRMANQEYLDILKQGVATWNQWWKEQHTSFWGTTDIQPDLSDADLSGARLDNADLSGANLSGARLDNADLFGANLSKLT